MKLVKRSTRVGVLLGLLLFSTACVAAEGKGSSKEEPDFVIIDKKRIELQSGTPSAVIVRDEATGCEYMILSPSTNSRTMVPYYDSDGNVKGCKNNEGA